MQIDESKQYNVVKPVAFVIFLAVFSYLGYYNAHNIKVDWLHQALAFFSGAVYVVCIFLGPFYIYIITYLKDISLPRRILAACLLPFLWMTKDVLIILESHPLHECLYWYFNPLNIWMVCLLMIEIGTGTLLARFLRQRQGYNIKILTPMPIIIALLGMMIFAGIYAWGQGENIFSVYMHGYRFLFGGGF